MLAGLSRSGRVEEVNGEGLLQVSDHSIHEHSLPADHGCKERLLVGGGVENFVRNAMGDEQTREARGRPKLRNPCSHTRQFPMACSFPFA